jgi:hypothetical protein
MAAATFSERLGVKNMAASIHAFHILFAVFFWFLAG